MFEWKKFLNKIIYDIMIIRDIKYDNWILVIENMFDVSDVLLFDFISIIVKVLELKINSILIYIGWIFVILVFFMIYGI